MHLARAGLAGGQAGAPSPPASGPSTCGVWCRAGPAGSAPAACRASRWITLHAVLSACGGQGRGFGPRDSSLMSGSMRGAKQGGCIAMDTLEVKPNSASLVRGNRVTRHTSGWSGGRVPGRLPLVLRVRELPERRCILVASHREGVTRANVVGQQTRNFDWPRDAPTAILEGENGAGG